MKGIVILVFCISSLNATSQINNVYFEYRIESLSYNGDSTRFTLPRIITLENFGSSPLTELGRIGKNEYAMKIEILKSHVGLKDDIIIAKCFYIKENEEWKEIYKYASFAFRIISGRSLNPLEKDWQRGSEGGGGFELSWDQLLYSY